MREEHKPRPPETNLLALIHQYGESVRSMMSKDHPMPSDTPSPISKQPTAYMVRCSVCGPSYLTGQEYSRQLSRANRLWQCPQCGDDAAWDDDNFEAMTQEEPPMPDPARSPHARLAELKYLVWSNARNAFWRANGGGYTDSVSMAGRYGREEAEKICHAPQWRCGQNPKDPSAPSEIVVIAPEHTSYFLALMAENELWRRWVEIVMLSDEDYTNVCERLRAARIATDLALESTRTAQGGA